jgi:hypothetical protein
MKKGIAQVSVTVEGDIEIPDLDNYDIRDIIHAALKTHNVQWWAAQIADENGSIIAIERQ